jgi:hypothetical protein
MDPLALKNRPPCYGWMGEYLKAFNVLSSSRQYGMGPNPIQLTEILAYIELFGTSDKMSLIQYVLRMDEAYLTTKAKQQEQKKNQAGNRSKDDGQRPGTKR